jgi:hypothetical protein
MEQNLWDFLSDEIYQKKKQSISSMSFYLLQKFGGRYKNFLA